MSARGASPAVIALGALLGLSLAGNAWLFSRGPEVVERTRTVTVATPPPMQECPPAPVCPPATVCPACPSGGVATGPRPPRPPRVDEAMAAQGEGEVGNAAATAERDPVQLAAQRSLANGMDRIVSSRSPAAAERFLQRNLPSIASMECAFRDPAAAEHVRMRLRELNALARPTARLGEAELVRYERELRCPRE